MKAVLLREYGDTSKLRVEDVETPKVKPDEVLIRERAASINPVDWKIRSGAAKERFPQKFPAILGRDVAGEVAEVGSAVTSLKKGERVMALANATYAEYVAVKASDVTNIPQDMSFDQAGAFPLVVLTGAQLIELAVKPQAGQTVLVTGALGSVGRTAVYVAKQHGAHVIAGVRKSQREEAAELGADDIVALDDSEDLKRMHDLDAIADTVGGKVISALLPLLRKDGVLGSVVGPPEDAKKYDIHVEAIMAHPDAGRLGELAEDAVRGEFSP